jgi:hypothetical protein
VIHALDLPVTVLHPAYFILNDIRRKDPLVEFGVYGMRSAREASRWWIFAISARRRRSS